MCTCVLLKLRARQPYLFGHPSSWNLKPVKQSNRPHTFFLPRSGLSLWEEQATAVSLVLTKQSFHLFHILSELITFSAHYSPFYLSLCIFCLSVFYPAISWMLLFIFCYWKRCPRLFVFLFSFSFFPHIRSSIATRLHVYGSPMCRSCKRAPKLLPWSSLFLFSIFFDNIC